MKPELYVQDPTALPRYLDDFSPRMKEISHSGLSLLPACFSELPQVHSQPVGTPEAA